MHPQPSPASPQVGWLGWASPLHSQDPVEDKLVLLLVQFPVVLFSASSALPYTLHGPEQMVYNVWSLKLFDNSPSWN